MISRTEGFITVADGERVWYETAGEGPDLILTHGLGGNAARSGTNRYRTSLSIIG